MRKAEHSDLAWFIEAGRAFCEHTPFEFDEGSYANACMTLIDSPEVISAVGDRCHCLALLVPNFYNGNEIIAKVFTIWGNGGLKCFREVERQAKERGAKFILADSFVEPRLCKFYERHGMTLTDSVYLKEVNDGH